MLKQLYLTIFLLSLFFIGCTPQNQLTKKQKKVISSSSTPELRIRSNNEEDENILKIGVLGDLNGSLGDPNYDRTVTEGMKYILNSNYEIILGTGDFTSGEDYKKRFSKQRFDEMWESFNQKILTPILRQGIPFLPTPGNHDANLERERGFYNDFWKNKLPNVQMTSTEAFPFYYSFIYKNVFFISLDDVRTQNLKDRTQNGVTQREWIINQLDSAHARGAIARIAFGHVPLYPILSKKKHGRGKYYEILRNEQQGKKVNSLEEILKKGNVSLAIFGHSHAYYPGIVHHKSEAIDESLPVLSMPCLGQGNRYLDQRTRKRSPRGFGEILINLNTGIISIDSHDFKGKLINKNTLPQKISPYSAVDIIRYDLKNNY